MNKMVLVMFGLVAVLVAASVTYAQGRGQGVHHEDMEEIMEEGTYQDLVDYRDSTGFNMMPWVDSEEEFEQMQERHEVMEEYHEEHGRRGCHGGYGHGDGQGMSYRWSS